MPVNCLAPITKCAYKKEQQQIKEEAFQDGDFIQKAHQYLSSPDVLEKSMNYAFHYSVNHAFHYSVIHAFR